MTAFALVLLLCVPADTARHPSHPEPGTQVIRGETIQALGLTRLSELFLLLDEWDMESPDGFTWLSTPGPAESVFSTSPVIMVDGHRVVPGKGIYATDLDRLPVSLSQIDYVEFISGTSTYSETPAYGPTIRFHTHPLEPGLQIRTGALLGNEAGDAGPHLFTEYASPNVDKIGPHLTLDGGYQRGRLSIRSTSAFQRQFVEDLVIRHIFDDIGEYPAHRLMNTAFRVGITSSTSRNEVLAGVSDLRDYALRAPETALLIGSRIYSASLSGSLERTSDGFEYHVGARDESMDEKYVDHSSGPRRSRIFGGHFTWNRPVGLNLVRIIGEIRHEILSRDKWPDRIVSRRAHLSGQWTGRFERFSPAVTVTAGVIRESPHAAIQAGSRWRIDDGTRLLLEAGYMRNVAIDNLWFEPTDADESSPVPHLQRADLLSMRANQASALIGLETAAGRPLSVQITQRLQRVETIRSFREEIGAGRVGGPTNTAVTTVRGDLRASTRVEQSLSYRFMYRSNDADSRDIPRMSTPVHRVRYKLLYEPVDGFTVSATAAYESAVTWEAARYPLFAGDETALRQDGVFLLNGSLQKWFWNDRLRGSIVFRNLLDMEKRYQPGGKNVNLALFVQAELVL